MNKDYARVELQGSGVFMTEGSLEEGRGSEKPQIRTVL